jgi:hypothetical protein
VATSLALTVAAMLTKALPCGSPNDIYEVHAMVGNGAMTDGLILQIPDKNRSVLRQTERQEAAVRRHLSIKITDPDRNAQFARADNSIMEWQPILLMLEAAHADLVSPSA